MGWAEVDEKLQTKVEEIIGEVRNDDVLDEQGCTSVVRRIDTDRGSFLLKSADIEKYRNWLKTEAHVLEKLKNNELIPVPTYYGFVEEMDSSHLIMSFENGITLTSALRNAKTSEEKKKLIRSFGQFLQQLHELKTMESLEDENDWLESQLIKAQSYVDTGQTEGSLQLLNKLKVNKPLPVQKTIIHGDCTTDNVLVIDGEVRVFIDVASMTVGDPRYDESLAIRNFVKNDDYIKAFYEGYRRYTVSEDEFQYFDEGLYEFF